MKKLKNTLMVTAGIVIGMLISVPAVSAASEYLTAVRSTQTFYMDGRQLDLEAYSINGNNYVKLRDVGQAVNFNVSYDAQTNSVRIAPNEPYSEDTTVAPAVTPTTPPTAAQDYIISVDHWSREDFSQQANPAVFTGYYDRELYNTIRQTMLDGTSQNPAYTMVAKGADYSAVVNVLGRLSGVKRYEHHTPNNFRNYHGMVCDLKGGVVMRKTLEDLYYGNIIPHEKQITTRSELQRMIKRAAECERKLAAMLNDEERHTLNVLMSAQQEIDGITAIENFILGFRLGVRLMVDCMEDDDGNVTDVR